MPGGDRTGPEGTGPRTGRALGYCAGKDRPGYQVDEWPAGGRHGRGYGRGRGHGGRFGWGLGPGRGFRHGFRSGFGLGGGRGLGRGGRDPQSPARGTEPDTIEALADDVARLKGQLRALEARLAEANRDDEEQRS